MTELTATSVAHQAAFDHWVASGELANEESLLVLHHWVETMAQPVLLHRMDGTVAYLNSTCAELVDKRRRDVLGRQLQEHFGTEWFATHEQQLREATPAHPNFSSRLRFSVEGTNRLYRIGTHVSFVSNGQPGAAWLMLQDITEEADAHSELQRANQLLSESNRDLEEFAYVASHDLQEPLRKIQAFGDRLATRLEDLEDDKAHDYLDRMQNASGRMQTLISDLLSFSRVTTAGRPLAPVALSDVVSNVLQNLEVAVSDAGANIHVGSLPTIDGDEPQLHQLMQNLIGNALKFRDPDRDLKLWIEAVIIGSRWLISVRDTGIGFDQQYAEKIFTVFQRLHGRSTYSGTGVGLAICRKIVERHGGSIRAQGEPGGGATFLIDLPRSLEELQAAT